MPNRPPTGPTGPGGAQPQPQPGGKPEPGTQLDVQLSLILEQELSQGGFGEVWMADWPEVGAPMVIKLLHEQHLSQASIVADFQGEARRTAQLVHPGIPPVHGLGSLGQRPYFVMRCLPGTDLLKAAQRRHAQAATVRDYYRWAIEVLIKVCDTLSFTHSKEWLHCDLKPQNLFVGEFGETYVIDWGMAVKVGQTQRGGTPGFLAPEQGAGDALDPRADVYALGCVLYWLLTGRAPAQAKKGHAGARDPLSQMPLPSQISSTVPACLDEIARRALAWERDQRTSSAADLREELRASLHSSLYVVQREYEAGAVICELGELGDEAYVLRSGSCSVEVPVAGGLQARPDLEQGACFGELALLLSEEKRTARVRAKSDCVLDVIPRDALEEPDGDTWLPQIARALAERFRRRDAELSQTRSDLERVARAAHARLAQAGEVLLREMALELGLSAERLTELCAQASSGLRVVGPHVVPLEAGSE